MPALTEEERASILGRMAGGLAYVGGAIDKPFAAARGAVAAAGDLARGDTRKAGEHAKQFLHLIPFSGTFQDEFEAAGIPVPEEHIWGREVLESLGAPKNRPGAWDEWGKHPEEAFWDIAGIAADLAIAPPVLPGLLPLTKLGRAAGKASEAMIEAAKYAPKTGKVAEEMTRAAKALAAKGDTAAAEKMLASVKGDPAKAIGIRAKELAELTAKGGEIPLTDIPGYVAGATPALKVKEIEQGLRGLVGWRAPAFSPWRAILGDQPFGIMGAGSKKAAKAVEAAYYSNYSPIPAFRSMFGATTKGKQNPAAQKALEEAAGEANARVGALQGLWPAMTSEHSYLTESYAKLQKYAQVADDPVGQATWQQFSRHVAEMQSKVKLGAHATQQQIRDLMQIPAGSKETLELADEFAGRFHNLMEVAVFGLEDAAYTKGIELGARWAPITSLWTPAHTFRRGAVGAGELAADAPGATFGPASARNPALDLPGGATTVNAIITDGMVTRPLSGKTEKLIAASPRQYGGFNSMAHGFAVDLVEAPGQADLGWVLALDPKKDQALVRFVSSETGVASEVKLPIKSLTKIDPDNVPAGKFLAPKALTGKKQRELQTEWLKKHGPPRPGYEVPTNAKDLRDDYLYHRFLKPALQREQKSGTKLFAPTEEGGFVLHEGKQIPLRPWLHESMSDAERWAAEHARHWKGSGPVYGANKELLAEGVGSVAAEVAADMAKRNSIPGGVFNKLFIDDHGLYMERINEQLHTLHTQHNFLRGVATAEQAEGMIPLREAWFDVRTKGNRPALTERGLETLTKTLGREADELFVPANTSKVLQGFQDLSEPGSQMHNAFGRMFDMWTAAVRFGWTTPYPAFHVRNRVAGLFQNLAADVPWQNRTLFKHQRDLHRWLVGKGPMPEFVDEVAAAKLLKHSRLTDISTQSAQELGHMATGGVLDVFRPQPTWTINPLKSRTVAVGKGVRGPRPGEQQFFLEALGEKGYSYVETMNRVPLYMEARANGLSVAQAKALVDRVQYDYGRMTGFENRVMRRVAPFYGWIKNNAIYHTSEILGNPGGKLGSTIRMAAQTQRISGGKMPRWLQEQVAIPLPAAITGTEEPEQSIIRQFGLPFEDLRTFQPTASRTFGRLVGQMHPAASLFYKGASGVDPYSGREIKHMEGPSHYLSASGIPALDAMFQASPLSRAFWTYKSLVDTRKTAPVRALNLLTGMQIGTYDMPRMLARDIVQAQKEKLERTPYVWEANRFFIPKHLQAVAGPEGQEELRRLRALEQEARRLKPLPRLEK
jgi:hypothetical protein